MAGVGDLGVCWSRRTSTSLAASVGASTVAGVASRWGGMTRSGTSASEKALDILRTYCGSLVREANRHNIKNKMKVRFINHLSYTVPTIGGSTKRVPHGSLMRQLGERHCVRCRPHRLVRSIPVGGGDGHTQGRSGGSSSRVGEPSVLFV